MSETPARRYKLLDRIAVGGTAEVFHAIVVEAGKERPVVVKRVLPQFARDERFRRLFPEEARVAKALDHPNIVRIIDYGELDNTCFIALEPVHGRDLAQLLRSAAERGERCPPVLAAMIAARVGRALQFAHEQVSAEGVPLQIIHRDVSPQNILVSFQGNVKLTDFGIAESALSAPSTGDALCGKVDYMAPEQAVGGRQVDHRSDLFALGCVLYEMLSGAPPFHGQTDEETLDNLYALRLPAPLAQLDAPPPLRAVLSELLRKLPSERFQQAAQLVGRLDAYAASCPEPANEGWLGEWAEDLANDGAREISTPETAVDDAVRALLGEPADAPSPPRLRPHRSPTEKVPIVRPLGRTATGQIATAPLAAGEIEASKATEGHTAQVRLAAVVAPQRDGRAFLPWIALLTLLLVGGVASWLVYRAQPSTPVVSGSDGDTRAERPAMMDAARRPRRTDTTAQRADATGSPTNASRRFRWLRSTPDGARVYLDGRLLGRTPRRVALPRSSFVLEFRKLGYRTLRKQLDTIPAAGSAVAVTLRRLGRVPASKVGYVTINSLPWSRVYIGGRFVKNTPLLRHKLRVGRHRIVLKDAQGAVRKRFTASVEANQHHRFTFQLKRTVKLKRIVQPTTP